MISKVLIFRQLLTGSIMAVIFSDAALVSKGERKGEKIAKYSAGSAYISPITYILLYMLLMYSNRPITCARA